MFTKVVLSGLITFTILGCFAAMNCCVSAADDGSSVPHYAGTFSNDRLAITLVTGSTADSYTGVIQRANDTFKCSAKLKNGALEGDFVDTNGNHFPFTASLDGPTLLLTTANTTLKLVAQKVEAINPLDRPIAAPVGEPDLTGAKAPAWVKPGIRVTYRFIGALVTGGATQMQEDPNGTWVDESGKHLAENIDPGVGASGYSQFDVAAVHEDAVALSQRSFTEFPLKDCLIVGGSSGSAVPAGHANDTWIDPAVLKKQAVVNTPQFKIYRGPYKIGEKTYGALFSSLRAAKSWTYRVYDEETGVMLHLATANEGDPKLERQGDELRPRKGTTQLAQWTLMSVRQIKSPWAGSEIPAALTATKTLVYEGVSTMNMSGSITKTPQRLTLKLHERNGDFLAFTQTHLVQFAGLSPIENTVERVTSENEVLPLCIDPPSLAKLHEAQKLDEDPITRYAVVVASIRRTETGKQVVVIRESARQQDPQTDLVYDRSTGLLSAFVITDPLNHSQVQMSLKSGE